MISQNLSMVYGDTAVFNVTVTQDGALYNVTSCTFWLTVKVNYTDTDTGVFQLTSGSGITIVDAPNGKIQIIVPYTQTYSPAFGYADTTYVYDIQMKTQAGAIKTLCRGKFTVLADVTRATS